MKIPDEHMDMQCSPPRQQRLEKVAQARRKAIRFFIAQHPDAAVKIPTADHNRPLGLYRRLPEGAIVDGSIDQKGRAICRIETPAIAPGFKDRRL